MTISTQPLALTADEVRHAVNQWSQQGLFRIRGVADRISVKAIIGHSCYTLRLKTQYESRRVSAAQVPYEGGSVDSGGAPPDAWDIPVTRPVDFQERQEKMTVPHTEQIVICSTCAGTGAVSCTSCQGSGKTNCIWCHGRGWQERMQPGMRRWSEKTVNIVSRAKLTVHHAPAAVRRCVAFVPAAVG